MFWPRASGGVCSLYACRSRGLSSAVAMEGRALFVACVDRRGMFWGEVASVYVLFTSDEPLTVSPPSRKRFHPLRERARGPSPGKHTQRFLDVWQSSRFAGTLVIFSTVARPIQTTLRSPNITRTSLYRSARSGPIRVERQHH